MAAIQGRLCVIAFARCKGLRHTPLQPKLAKSQLRGSACLWLFSEHFVALHPSGAKPL